MLDRVNEWASPLTRGRGLKLKEVRQYKALTHVAPHAGAWIETFDVFIINNIFFVAPHAGAWIETDISSAYCVLSVCRPSRGGVD